MAQCNVNVNEKHVSKDEDVKLLDTQGHRNAVEHAPVERTVIGKGTVVDEKVYHHGHHVVQPIIKKETVDSHRIHTTVPTHSTTHEAPIIHESVVHAPIALDKFLSGGGQLSGDGMVNHDDISQKVLGDGVCKRGEPFQKGTANVANDNPSNDKATHGTATNNGSGTARSGVDGAFVTNGS